MSPSLNKILYIANLCAVGFKPFSRRKFLSTVFNLEIFPADIYFLEKLPSEINFQSILIIFFLSLFVSAIASYIPANNITKMKTFRALKYD